MNFYKSFREKRNYKEPKDKKINIKEVIKDLEKDGVNKNVIKSAKKIKE